MDKPDISVILTTYNVERYIARALESALSQQGVTLEVIVVVLAANALRWWCIATLGPYWSARVIVIPGTTLVRSGPYRWFAHPNYVAVIIEGAALPLAGSAWITACTFTVLNAALLTVRLRCETQALAAAGVSVVA